MSEAPADSDRPESPQRNALIPTLFREEKERRISIDMASQFP
jgi:hypothetical protein